MNEDTYLEKLDELHRLQEMSVRLGFMDDAKHWTNEERKLRKEFADFIKEQDDE